MLPVNPPPPPACWSEWMGGRVGPPAVECREDEDAEEDGKGEGAVGRGYASPLRERW
jgi:hypothetical protein